MQHDGVSGGAPCVHLAGLAVLRPVPLLQCRYFAFTQHPSYNAGILHLLSTPPTMQVFCIYSASLLQCRYFAFTQHLLSTPPTMQVFCIYSVFLLNTGISHSLCIPPTMQVFHICSESPAQCRYFKFAQYLSYAAYIYIKSRYSPYSAGILHLFSISRTLQVLHTCFISHFSHCTLAYSIARTMQIRYTYRV